MKNNILKPKRLPKHIKFATFNSNNEDEILLEILIANLIRNGTSFNGLLKATDNIEKKKDREEMKTKITNITLDFINLNPEYAVILKQNNKAQEFLNILGLDF